ncbi:MULTISPECIES: glycosyltransferase family 2 protein [unclassified Adlercreutzia]|uniref:glycosyltransferase family 2 protein n=1 Tax=unclassified Adlercreutzia TaxID=2636013 RepID=UPI0013ED881E|nr:MULTISPECIES: glycosyltransferase family 2 protein [unclassified Adlercreutzia]
MQTVSVIIPVYNALPYLEQALESVRVQTYTNLQVICVNDGSTDGSLETIKRFVEADSRFQLIDQANQGYGAACNHGLRASTGEWVAILEPDDWLDADSFESALAFATQHGPDADIVKAPFWRVISTGPRQQLSLSCNFKGRKVASQPFRIEEQPWLLEEHPSIWSALYRRSFLEEKDIVFPEYPGAGWADNRFLIDTICQAERILYTDKASYRYREDSTENYEQFIKRNKLLPFDRWQEMADRLDSLGITDRGVLAAHYKRGFAYMNDVANAIGLDDEDVARAASAMLQRMEPDVVFADVEIAPDYKKAFAAAAGISLSKISTTSYRLRRCLAMLRKLKALGAGNAIALARYRLAERAGVRP